MPRWVAIIRDPYGTTVDCCQCGATILLTRAWADIESDRGFVCGVCSGMMQRCFCGVEAEFLLTRGPRSVHVCDLHRVTYMEQGYRVAIHIRR